MKTLKFSTLLIALASVFTFSSCLDSGNDDYGNRFRSYVTITDSGFGYTFHDDVGCTLKPTAASIQAVLPGLATSNVKRAFVAFELVNDETTTQLLPGKTYDINLVQDYYANIPLPTYGTTRRNPNPATAEADTLISKNNGQINYVNENIWAINGYVNAEMTIVYDGKTSPKMKLYYNPNDVDATNNTLTLNVYFNSNEEYSYTQAQSVFSFELPSEVHNAFQKDSINLVLKANLGSHDLIGSPGLTEVGRCKLATKDLLPVSY